MAECVSGQNERWQVPGQKALSFLDEEQARCLKLTVGFVVFPAYRKAYNHPLAKLKIDIANAFSKNTNSK